MESMEIDINFWKGKKVLITGHTGFKGSWLALCLQKLGSNITGIAIDPPTNPNLYQVGNVAKKMTSLKIDIRDKRLVNDIFKKYQPEIVFHLAAQSLVQYSYKNPVETYETNVIGTLNILEGIRNINSVHSVIMVTTDKCYDNKEWIWGYRENDPIGGDDLYSSSKGAAELLIASYRYSYFNNCKNSRIGIASVRAGNVIGGGDWAENRLVPDVLKAFQNSEFVQIRNPNSVRPWQHVLEPLSGYMLLAEKMFFNKEYYSQAWNFGPYDHDVKNVQAIVEKISDFWGNKNKGWVSDKRQYSRESNYLKLDCSKANTYLGWNPKWDINKALSMTVEWHKGYLEGKDMQILSTSQIGEFFNIN